MSCCLPLAGVSVRCSCFHLAPSPQLSTSPLLFHPFLLSFYVCVSLSLLVASFLHSLLLSSGGSGWDKNSRLCWKALGNLAGFEPLWNKIGWWVCVTVSKRKKRQNRQNSWLMWFLWWLNQTAAFSLFFRPLRFCGCVYNTWTNAQFLPSQQGVRGQATCQCTSDSNYLHTKMTNYKILFIYKIIW